MKSQSPSNPTWPGIGKLCMLEVFKDRPCEPLGLLGFDVMLPEEIAREVHPWVPDDAGGRVLFTGTQDHLWRGDEGPFAPRPDVPLLVWLTHRAVRVLLLCTPTEAPLLAQRLRVLCSVSLGCETIEDCSPASLASLITRWFDADPKTPALLPPAWSDRRQTGVITWRPTWSQEPLGSLLRLPEEFLQDDDEAEYMSYEDDPIVVAPLRFLVEDPSHTPADLNALFEKHQDLFDLIQVGPHTGLACSYEPRQLLALAPLTGENWRPHLTALRDGLADVLGCEVACCPAHQDQWSVLWQLEHRLLRDLPGSDEVYHPPLDGARREGPASDRAEVLRSLLLSAGGVLPHVLDPGARAQMTPRTQLS